MRLQIDVEWPIVYEAEGYLRAPAGKFHRALRLDERLPRYAVYLQFGLDASRTQSSLDGLRGHASVQTSLHAKRMKRIAIGK